MLTDIILKINKSKSYIEVFDDLSNWNKDYKKIAKLIHPDICREYGAKEALTKLNSYKEELEKGKTHSDDAGLILYNIAGCKIKAENRIILSNSQNNYNKLMSYKEKMDIDFQRYIPYYSGLSMEEKSLKTGFTELDFKFKQRSIPLSSLGKLPQGHVNWILSRMLEFIAYLYKKKFVHAGINPDSVYVEPVNHGINVISFYHMTEINKKLSTASAKYFHFYPEHIKTKKIATPDVDIELCKRTAVYLLGDQSGIGTSLRKTHNNAFLDFINKTHSDPIETYLEYRKMIEKNFERKFLPFLV